MYAPTVYQKPAMNRLVILLSAILALAIAKSIENNEATPQAYEVSAVPVAVLVRERRSPHIGLGIAGLGLAG